MASVSTSVRWRWEHVGSGEDETARAYPALCLVPPCRTLSLQGTVSTSKGGGGVWPSSRCSQTRGSNQVALDGSASLTDVWAGEPSTGRAGSEARG